MKAQPISDNCRRNFQLRTHACFGISPFNSYFSEERIRDLAQWGKSEFESMHFFVPDVPSAYTLEALGYDSEKAAWKARRQCQYLHNKIHKALSSVGFSDSDACRMVLNWETLTANKRYVDLYDEVKARFNVDTNFQATCIEASRWVLERRVPNEQVLTPTMLRSAVRYLLAEIPLFVDAAGIVGTNASVFCYHQCVQFLDDLFNGRLSLPVSSAQGFVVIEPQVSTTLSMSRPILDSGVHLSFS